VDRVFTIRGAGTVVTGTLTGGPIEVGREVELFPTGLRARVRGLQTHKRSIETATPVARVAANLVGVERDRLERGDVLGLPGQWRPASTIEVLVRPVRGLDHPLTGRGAYKLYAGSAERDARVRFYAGADDSDGAFARIRLSAPLVLDVHDRFVLREAGRRETVAGGVVLDADPPARPGSEPGRRLAARSAATREELPALLVAERGAIRASDVAVLTGISPREVPGASRVGAWWVADGLRTALSEAILSALEAHHRDHPLRGGAELSLARSAASDALEGSGRGSDPGLVEALIDELASAGVVVRTAFEVRLPSHHVALEDEDVARLVRAVGEAEPMPPSIAELESQGFAREVIDAAARAGAVVRIGPQVVMTAAFVRRAEEIVRAEAAKGITVSAFRERLGTSRKYAVPLLEYFDQRGVTRRQGDLRFPRS
jgi:selenocysteine-specific elongation factor